MFDGMTLCEQSPAEKKARMCSSSRISNGTTVQWDQVSDNLKTSPSTVSPPSAQAVISKTRPLPVPPTPKATVQLPNKVATTPTPVNPIHLKPPAPPHLPRSAASPGTTYVEHLPTLLHDLHSVFSRLRYLLSLLPDPTPESFAALNLPYPEDAAAMPHPSELREELRSVVVRVRDVLNIIQNNEEITELLSEKRVEEAQAQGRGKEKAEGSEAKRKDKEQAHMKSGVQFEEPMSAKELATYYGNKRAVQCKQCAYRVWKDRERRHRRKANRREMKRAWAEGGAVGGKKKGKQKKAG